MDLYGSLIASGMASGALLGMYVGGLLGAASPLIAGVGIVKLVRLVLKP